MIPRLKRKSWAALLGAALICAVLPSFAQDASDGNTPGATAPRGAIEAYLAARRTYEAEAQTYWQSITDKRRVRFAKRRDGKPIALDDYVLTQPPLYSGPPRPAGYIPPEKEPAPRPEPIPNIADFLKAAEEQYRFVPDRPKNDLEFKRAYAKAAAAAGLTREQAVRIYAFETGGNGTYDGQAGIVGNRKNARPISPAMGYNQLLSTNSVSLLAEHGDKIVKTLKAANVAATKIAALQQMVDFSRTVPNVWSHHDRLAKTTPGGMGIHAAVLDRDIGPLLQTQKLLDSVVFARSKGHERALTAAELEMMNFTGDGNGFDLVTMPQDFREKVPTSNFFQRGGYERNPIARRTGTAAALFKSIDTKMDSASQAQGAKELFAAF
ncbi:MAG: hypothetical protein WCG92_04345 [Hyphomicrobiales bacterium]